MLGSDLELSRHMVCHKLTEEGIILVIHQVIKSYTRADKHLLNPIYLLYLKEQTGVFRVVNLKMLAGLGGKTLFTGADSALLLSVAGGITEIGGRAAYVVDIALKIGKGGYLFSLLDNAPLAS